MQFQGFGSPQANLIIYCNNTPTTSLLINNQIIPICYPDIEKINTDNGNGWRKIFNVYAKLLFEINPLKFKSWQDLRNDFLLQSHCNHQLVLNPDSIPSLNNNTLQILMGKTFALTHYNETQIDWIEPHIAKVKDENVFITPYFDYRQFNNEKIKNFAKIVKTTIN